MDPGPQQIGKLLIIIGMVITLAGLLIVILSRFGLFRLPGDLEFGSRNWKVYIPIASSIILSIILTLILWIINYLRK